LIRLTGEEGKIFVEWTTDYLSDPSRGGDWDTRVRAISIQRLANVASARGKIDLESLNKLSEGQSLLDETLTPAQAQFLFEAALQHGQHMGLWFRKAASLGVRVWELLRAWIVERRNVEQARRVMPWLGSLDNTGAVEVLGSAFEVSDLSSAAEAALSQVVQVAPEGEAVVLAASILGREREERDVVAPQIFVASFEVQWKTLIRRIEVGDCVPVLGPGVSADNIDLNQVAKRWAAQWNYPLSDRDDLPRVAQFLAIEIDAIEPKDIFARICRDAPPPDFSSPNQIHRTLAELPFPVYITTNYDDFMTLALKKAQFTTSQGETKFKQPKVESCSWNTFTEESAKIGLTAKRSRYVPSPDRPLVYHLHGHHSVPQSMVLTEDDYLGFLAWMAGDYRILPAAVSAALSGSSLLFVGYSHQDWTFRVLFRAFVERLTGTHVWGSVSVQPVPEGTTPEERTKVLNYLTRYCSNHRIPMDVYWGDASEFAYELRKRWESR
jgi:hypothetical protein